MATPPEESRTTIEQQFSALAADIVAQSAADLLSTYGAPADQIRKALPEPETQITISLGATIGFTGEHVRGVLALSVDNALAQRLNPLSSKDDDPVNVDWVGELANQLLGRIKNKLLSRGIELQLSTPLAVQGSTIHIGTRRRKATRLGFSHNDERIDLWWDAQIDPELTLTSSTDNSAHTEGDMLFF